MAQAAPAGHAEHSSMEPLDSAIADTVPDAATAAAAAALVALPQAAAGATGQSMAAAQRYHCVPPCALSECDVPWCCAYCRAGDFMAPLGAGPRVDSDGQQLCQLCPVRLSRAKGKLHVHGPGRICQRCYNQQRHSTPATAAAAPAAVPVTPRKRRAESDPGEPRPRSPSPRRTRPTTRRVTPPRPAPVEKKQRTTRQDDRIMRQLEETVARREAWLAAQH
jgi:hypothetical protein